MLRFACIALLTAGCYSPKLQSPGFFCHEEDFPACPDGQQCVSGRCQNPGTHSIMFKDMGSPPGGGDDGGMSGGDVDMAHAHAPQDLSMPSTTHDLSMVHGTMTGCAGLLQCENNCPASSTTCPTTCQNNATSQGNSLFQALINCVVQACPNTLPSDPCFNTSSTTCTDCVNQSQMTGGPCQSQVTACDNDLP